MKDSKCFGNYDFEKQKCLECCDGDCIHFQYVKKGMEQLSLSDLRLLFAELEKKSFSVDMGMSETQAVRLVDIEDLLINQFK